MKFHIVRIENEQTQVNKNVGYRSDFTFTILEAEIIYKDIHRPKCPCQGDEKSKKNLLSPMLGGRRQTKFATFGHTRIFDPTTYYY